MAVIETYTIHVFERPQDFLAIVLDEHGECMTIGCERTAAEALAWAKSAVEAEAWVEGNFCPPDMYDRERLSAAIH
jgi:hypothetical protein